MSIRWYRHWARPRPASPSKNHFALPASNNVCSLMMLGDDQSIAALAAVGVNLNPKF